MRGIMHPRSLAQIWDDVKSYFFRVREVDTLEDYIILEIPTWMQGRPHMLSGAKCAEHTMGRYLLWGHEQKWALLSSEDEIKFFKTLKETQVLFRTKKAYRSGIST